MATLRDDAPVSGPARPIRDVAAVDSIAAGAEAAATSLFLAISVGYFALTWFFAARKLLWNDELYTSYVATQPTMQDVWGALTAGGEQTPPLFYAMTRASLLVVRCEQPVDSPAGDARILDDECVPLRVRAAIDIGTCGARRGHLAAGDHRLPIFV